MTKATTLALRNGSASRKWHASRARARARQTAFLRALRRNPNVTAAAAISGIPRRSLYDLRADDETFAAKWDEALDASVDEVEEKAFRIAKDGDNQMIQFVLKAHRPERYRETSRMEIDTRLCGVIVVPQKEDKEP